ncbi:gephyrin-like molybdotransferase Glp [Amycolatopsis benzoatilytica]|uniref:molybdopterin molybdotransferase MoeA n=1 Tax=Amycolatopsis benzoatilytica TaxID=346045 RepID=UPI00037CBC94|nr:gephyrin-like molybdotransferase Glp [Amycolatopsis benzoatilytica]
MVRVISVDAYRQTVTELLGRAPAISVPVAEAAGLVAARDVFADVALPPFDNSAMDGYAVRAADVADAPVTLPVADDIPAGRIDVQPLKPGTAQRIMTGAPLPPGADAVVMVEDTDRGMTEVRISRAAPEGNHIRRIGEDVTKGALALHEGTVLSHSHLGLAAAVGLASLEVYRPLSVLVVSTGTELVEAPNPLQHGQIYESNSVMLAAALRGLGCQVEVVRSVVDDVAEFRRLIEPRLASVDLLLTSGGVSAGAYEVVKDALSGQGVEFQKIAMQPGGPQGCGRWNGVPVVTLPGNPVSVLVSFEAFLRPAVLAAMGHVDVDRQRVRARLTEDMTSPAGRRQYRRGFFTPVLGEVTGMVGPRGGPGSHLLAAFTQANCLIVLPEEVAEVAEGDEVDVLLL